MKNLLIKIIALVIIVMLVAFSVFVVTTQQDIKDINESIDDVEDKPSSVRILSDTSSGTSPLTVNFKPLLLNIEEDVKYFWDFGDGNTSTESNPSYTYRGKGIFCCNLTIESSEGELKDNYNVTVFQNNPPKIKIKCDTTYFRFNNKDIVFDVEAFDPEGEDLQYAWKLKYPAFFGYQKIEEYDTKSFSKRFYRPGVYTAELIVTDESGNKVIDYENVQVQKHQIEQFIGSMQGLILFQLPLMGSFIWKLPFIQGPVSDYLDEHWLNWSSTIQTIISAALSLMDMDYIPPIPKADLVVSDIEDINLSTYVNETGVVQPDASVISSFVISNHHNFNTTIFFQTI